MLMSWDFVVYYADFQTALLLFSDRKGQLQNCIRPDSYAPYSRDHIRLGRLRVLIFRTEFVCTEITSD